MLCGSKDAHPFSQIFFLVADLSNDIREDVNKVCDWSVPTFYRKLRSVTNPKANSKIRKPLSNADLQAIVDVYISHIQRVHTSLISIKEKLKTDKNTNH
mgnify:CR=1 FL=1